MVAISAKIMFIKSVTRLRGLRKWNKLTSLVFVKPNGRGITLPLIILLLDGRVEAIDLYPMQAELKFIEMPIILAFIWLNPPLLEVSGEVFRTEAILF